MARNHLAAFLLIGLALAGCKKDEPAEKPVDLVALRVRRDSVARAKAHADSLATIRYTTCSDSVGKVLQKTAAGRRVLAAKRPVGVAVPEVLAACGTNPSQPLTQVASTDTTRVESPGTRTAVGTKQTTPPVSAPTTATTPPAAAPGTPTGMTPQQRQVARADSIRKAKEQARADSLAHVVEVARADSVTRAKVDSIRGDSLRQIRETEVLRETFAYSGANRDPFVSLIDLPSEGPEFVNLQLVAVYQDLRYAGNSIAVVRDKDANKRYNVRVGDRIGRMKIAQIRQRDVVFTIEDLGFERQETLSLRKQEEHTP
ncbi:MAG: hypothetical protein ABI679_02980 [Gemmatimonadota bacterium]